MLFVGIGSENSQMSDACSARRRSLGIGKGCPSEAISELLHLPPLTDDCSVDALDVGHAFVFPTRLDEADAVTDHRNVYFSLMKSDSDPTIVCFDGQIAPVFWRGAWWRHEVPCHYLARHSRNHFFDLQQADKQPIRQKLR